MSRYTDRDLGMHRDITRRDFVGGVGAAVGGSLFAPEWLLANDGTLTSSIAPDYYPPGY